MNNVSLLLSIPITSEKFNPYLHQFYVILQLSWPSFWDQIHIKHHVVRNIFVSRWQCWSSRYWFECFIFPKFCKFFKNGILLKSVAIGSVQLVGMCVHVRDFHINLNVLLLNLLADNHARSETVAHLFIFFGPVSVLISPFPTLHVKFNVVRCILGLHQWIIFGNHIKSFPGLFTILP